MESIANRIIKVCEQVSNGNMSAFARAIGVTPAYISKLKNEPDRTPSDRTISDICRVFHVNETWLRTGTGESNPSLTREDEIADLVRQATNDSNGFKLAFIKMICSRSDKEIEILEKAMRDVLENM